MAKGPGTLTDTPLVEIHGLAAGGDGVGRLPDGRTVFVPWTAPGDQVRVRVVSAKKRWARGIADEVLRPSEDRVEPPCRHFGTCGGCSLQHVAIETQRHWKGRFVREALKRIGNLDGIGDIPVEAAPAAFHYRGRMTFTVAHRGGRVRAGLREAGRPGRVAEVEFCHLAEPRIQEVWSSLRRSLKRPGLVPPGAVMRVTIRAVEEGVVLIFSPRCPEGAAQSFGGLPHVVQVWESGAKGARRLWGEVEGHETWFGRSVAVPAPSFTQVNASAGQLLLDAVVEAAGEVGGRRVVDAYAGLSLTGRELAARGAAVTAIEMDPSAAAALAETGGVRVLEGRVEARLAEALPADLVIVNPPRSGLDEHVVHQLLKAPPERLLYVSCDPATLARDLERLAPGFSVEKIRAFDLFPQTPHVEALVALRAGAPDIESTVQDGTQGEVRPT